VYTADVATSEPTLAKINIEYCAECGDAGVALKAAGDLLAVYEDRLSGITLIPSWDGVFEVTFEGKLIFSKRRLGRHAQPDELVRLVGERFAAAAAQA
jgi:selenoprotein W-related protein